MPTRKVFSRTTSVGRYWRFSLLCRKFMSAAATSLCRHLQADGLQMHLPRGNQGCSHLAENDRHIAILMHRPATII